MADTTTPAAAAVEAVQKAPEPSTEVPKTEQPKDPSLEAFARKERQLRKQQQQIMAEKQELQRRIAEYETGYISKSKLKEDPWSFLSEAGVDYNQLTEQILAQPNMNDPATKAMMAKIRQLEEKQGAAEKAAVEATSRQYEQALGQIRSEVKLMVDSNVDFETIKETGMQDAVVELIEQTFNSDGVLMDIEEAAKQVEEHLLAEAEKMSGLKKLQARQKLKTEQQTSVPETKQTDTKTIKTLTNAVDAQPKSGRMTDKERRARAFAAFNGTLKG